MSAQDPVSDMLTRIRNAQAADKATVSMPSSKHKVELARVLQDEGYIHNYEVDSEKLPTLTIKLKYYEGKGVIDMIQRVSRPGLRVYKAATDLPKIVGGLGVAIISTSKGLMSDKQARKAGIGGEVICKVA